MRVTVRQDPGGTRRGLSVSVDGMLVGKVGASHHFGDGPAGWHYYTIAAFARFGIPFANSASEGVDYPTREACRDALVAYVKKHAKAEKKP